jgi:hypothetical protein
MGKQQTSRRPESRALRACCCPKALLTPSRLPISNATYHTAVTHCLRMYTLTCTTHMHTHSSFHEVLRRSHNAPSKLGSQCLKTPPPPPYSVGTELADRCSMTSKAIGATLTLERISTHRLRFRPTLCRGGGGCHAKASTL